MSSINSLLHLLVKNDGGERPRGPGETALPDSLTAGMLHDTTVDECLVFLALFIILAVGFFQKSFENGGIPTEA